MNLITDPNTEIVLAELCHSLQLGIQLSDGPMKAFDGYLSKLNDLGLFHRSIVLGPIVMRRSYGIDGPSDSGQLIQAAVTTDFGAAAIFWDSEDYCDAKQFQTIESDALSVATPLRDCLPAIRSMVWPHIPKLVMRLLDHVHIG